jgi:lysyl-tRNA synthetase class 2
MLISGFNKVFTINRAFRDENVDNTHLIEFLSIEYYMAYVDYMYMMNFTEEMLKYVAKKIHGNKFVTYNGHKLDFEKKWERISIHESLINMFGKDLFILPKQELLKIAKKQGLVYGKAVSSGNVIIDIFDKCIGDLIIQPTFIYDYPKDATVMCYDITMAKEKRGNASVLERFELYIGGMELANCYSELNDPIQQKESFEKFLKGRNKTLRMDPNFYHALQVGMPPSSGVGFGIDRLLMILTNSAKIYETIPFSTYHENI